MVIVTLLLVGVSMGCSAKYNGYNPSPVGIFHPNGCVNLRGRDAHGLLAIPHVYTVCSSVRFSEMGIMTYTDPDNAGNHEVARLEFSDKSIYVWTSTLREVGRIEFAQNQRKADKSGRAISDGFWNVIRGTYSSASNIIGFVFAVFLICAVIKGIVS